MNLTISMNTVLNFLHALELSTSQKQWLADKLYEEMKTERKAVATTASGWPKIRREDMHISPEVMKLGQGIKPLPDDFDYDKAKQEHLMQKYV